MDNNHIEQIEVFVVPKEDLNINVPENIFYDNLRQEKKKISNIEISEPGSSGMSRQHSLGEAHSTPATSRSKKRKSS
ncbi:hypothetical protein FQR65_LT04013 [Abscondita terminalis]|nr:hypothetical protein FQR65_LT04013 [Abscondita terminalis]